MHQRFPTLINPYLKLLGACPLIKVTGTNGKGSVCAMLDACLGYEGLRVGLFTSPHLRRVTERFRIAGEEISVDTLEGHAETILHMVRELVDRHGESHRPSFFESLILIAIHLFSEQQVDIAIFEAGVGGHNDPTSALPGEFSVITTIGLDHKEQLGSSLASIAADKAGIASPKGHLVLGPDISSSLCEVIKKEVRSREVEVSQATLAGLRPSWSGLHNPTMIDRDTNRGTVRYRLPLLGRHQVSNFATLVALIERLRARGVVRNLDCLRGVEKTRWAGRLEVREGSPCYVIDAAHNEQGIQALIDSLADLVPYADRVLLYGASADKDYNESMRHLNQLAQEIFLVEGFYRAEKGTTLADVLPAAAKRSRCFLTPREAINFFADNPSYGNKVVIATGSIFMIGNLLDCMDSQQPFKIAGAEVRAND
jgi:dihydrofolate synthase/folylpolyglutamate synthase